VGHVGRLKKTPFELRDFDLNDAVQDAIELLGGVAIARGVRMDRFMTPVPLPVMAIGSSFSKSSST
jgi:hypothetical protein